MSSRTKEEMRQKQAFGSNSHLPVRLDEDRIGNHVQLCSTDANTAHSKANALTK